MSLRHAILGALARRPASGYDLLQKFDQKLNNIWWASHGAVYTELQKLERDGLVEVSDTGARNRQEHRATDAGLDVLRAWLRQEPARRPRDDLVLRVDSLWTLPTPEAIAVLHRLATTYRQRLDRYLQIESRIDPATLSGPDLFDYVALRAGIHHERAMLAWVEESVERIGARSPVPEP